MNGRPASIRIRRMTLATGATNEGGAVATNTADNETILPLKKVCKTSHQIQSERQNQKKIKDIQGRAHHRATHLVACRHIEDERGG